MPGCPSLDRRNREVTLTPFRYLTAMPPKGSTRARILPGCPSLDSGSRVPGVGFEPRAFRQSLEHFIPFWFADGGPNQVAWLEREFIDRKVRGSNSTSASRLPLSRLERPGSIREPMPHLCGVAVRHRKGATAGRFFFA
ncbi:hypothetical protein T265_06990 [Opisthorchis viverrini]|uniref:Uncharacterized protein n=1 Tax=Opisthorchis viverrini TaxID=6198 RepID=A0A074ZEI2_OPIVI|nr:hypothetical protein T265_06990 [Opisthorchis viverrini]KER25588.1 hypothetical protein T265_06990 [Opisthorchis viverrini]